MVWCPWLNSPDAPIFLRADGTFGRNDPISWPQLYHPDAPHLACIPVSDPNPYSLVYMFRCGLRKDNVTFTDDFEDRLRVGTLSEDFAHKLKVYVDSFLKDVQEFFSTVDDPHPRLKHLVQRLKTVVAKVLELRATLPQLRLMFGLASRFYLEAHGYTHYYVKYRPMLDSQVKPTVNSNLVGVWSKDERTCMEYHRMGVPVWFLRKPTQVSTTADKFLKSSEPRIYQSRPLWPPGCFRDDGSVREESAILQEQTDTGNLLKVIDSWVKLKLENDFR